MKLSGVGKRYGSRTVLRDVSLEIFPGTVTLLAGANGAGKSTLLRIMAGLARPTTGNVCQTFALTDQKEGSGPRPGIGYLGHATFIYPALSALENLAFWGGLHDCDTRRESLLAVLKRVELARYAEERAGAFSRGMAQRLNLARILLLAPRLLLLDEPGTGLDKASQGLLRDEIGAARALGAAIVWISHDLTGDSACADRLITLAQRSISYDGPPEGLCSQDATTKAKEEATTRGATCLDLA